MNKNFTCFLELATFSKLQPGQVVSLAQQTACFRSEGQIEKDALFWLLLAHPILVDCHYKLVAGSKSYLELLKFSLAHPHESGSTFPILRFKNELSDKNRRELDDLRIHENIFLRKYIDSDEEIIKKSEDKPEITKSYKHNLVKKNGKLNKRRLLTEIGKSRN